MPARRRGPEPQAWRLSRIRQLWAELRLTKANTPRHTELVARIRYHSRETAEAASMINGRMVDAYANIQTLKLFSRDEESDRYMRQGFDFFQETVLSFTRFITGVRASMALLSGLMIVTMNYIRTMLPFTDPVTHCKLKGKESLCIIVITIDLFPV